LATTAADTRSRKRRASSDRKSLEAHYPRDPERTQRFLLVTLDKLSIDSLRATVATGRNPGHGRCMIATHAKIFRTAQQQRAFGAAEVAAMA
jgi:hypothetical protein